MTGKGIAGRRHARQRLSGAWRRAAKAEQRGAQRGRAKAKVERRKINKE